MTLHSSMKAKILLLFVLLAPTLTFASAQIHFDIVLNQGIPTDYYLRNSDTPTHGSPIRVQGGSTLVVEDTSNLAVAEIEVMSPLGRVGTFQAMWDPHGTGGWKFQNISGQIKEMPSGTHPAVEEGGRIVINK